MKPYIDSDVLSLYTALPPRGPIQAAQWSVAQTIFTVAKEKRLKLFTSSFLLVEARRGNKRAAEKRVTAAERYLTIIRETKKTRAAADDLLANFSEATRVVLEDDARHYAAAAEIGAEAIITFNTSHFLMLQKEHPGEIKILSPFEALAQIAALPWANPRLANWVARLSRKTPFLRRILRETKRRGLQACREDGFHAMVMRHGK